MILTLGEQLEAVCEATEKARANHKRLVAERDAFLRESRHLFETIAEMSDITGVSRCQLKKILEADRSPTS